MLQEMMGAAAVHSVDLKEPYNPGKGCHSAFILWVLGNHSPWREQQHTLTKTPPMHCCHVQARVRISRMNIFRHPPA